MAVIRLNAPKVKNARITRQTHQTGRSQPSGTRNQNDQDNGRPSARITPGSAQPFEPK